MGDSLFSEGGPYNVRRVGRDEYRMGISIPTDSQGMLGRECPNSSCSPGYFKVKPGTGITENQTIAYCPYCRHGDDPENYLSGAQRDYALGVMQDEIGRSLDDMIRRGFDLGPSGKKRYGSGFLSMELSYKPSSRRRPTRPQEEELRRDLTCPKCRLDHAVFGLATWCPDCGADVFSVHLEEEFAAVQKMLSAVGSRRVELGARVAARDIENALEDTVSIFEAVLKSITRRFLSARGSSIQEIDDLFSKTIRSQYQTPALAARLVSTHLGIDLFMEVSAQDARDLTKAFEKRHPITHNLGIVDRKYLQRVQTGELDGRDVRIDVPEIQHAAAIALTVLKDVYERLFGSPEVISGQSSQ